MKGPVKENDLSWNLPALRMFPELLAACSLAPLAQLLTTWHSVTCLHLFSGIASLPLQPAVWFAGGLPVDKTWLQKQRCTNIWMHCSQSTANISGIFFFIFIFSGHASQSQPLLKTLAMYYSFPSCPCWYFGSRPGECRADLYGLWIQLLLKAWIMSQPFCQSSVKLGIRKNTMQTCK